MAEFIFGSLGLLLGVVGWLAVRMVPERQAYVVQRFGKYHRTLPAGLQLTVPFVDQVAFKVDLREQVLDVRPQTCISQDNVQVVVDGILYLQVIDPKAAVYGSTNYALALLNLAQTTLRAEVGKLTLDRLFEAREQLTKAVVLAADEAARTWGVKVLRYEVKDILPPDDVLESMKKQVNAERDRRALVAKAEGSRAAAVAASEGDRQAAINQAEGAKAAQILRAEGEARAMELNARARALAVEVQAQAEAKAQVLKAQAQAQSLEEVGSRLQANAPAAQLELAHSYVEAFGQLAHKGTTLVVPANVGDVAGMLAMAKVGLDAGSSVKGPTPGNGAG